MMSDARIHLKIADFILELIVPTKVSFVLDGGFEGYVTVLSAQCSVQETEAETEAEAEAETETETETKAETETTTSLSTNGITTTFKKPGESYSILSV